jgi:hypothetical protein
MVVQAALRKRDPDSITPLMVYNGWVTVVSGSIPFFLFLYFRAFFESKTSTTGS